MSLDPDQFDPLAARDSLGLPFGVWLFLSVLFWLALYFKFNRFWSVRNLDLILILAQTPGLVYLSTLPSQPPAWVFAFLFIGLGVWSLRCTVDLALIRRPLLEPNLNGAGLSCLLAGLLLLVVVEAITVDSAAGAIRNPGDPHAEKTEARPPVTPAPDGTPDAAVESALRKAPPPADFKRMMAALGHLGITLGLVAVGFKHFQRPLIGLSMAVGFLILPYTRIALIDSGQLVASALIVMAILAYRRPTLAALSIAVASAWMPPVAGLIPLWAGFYRGRGLRRFLAVAVPIVLSAWLVASSIPTVSRLALALGARSLNEVGLLPNSEAPSTLPDERPAKATDAVKAPPSPQKVGSFWNGVEPAYRLPVLVLHACLATLFFFWPFERNLGHVIAQSTLLLIASEFWYLDEGGTHAVLYLPLLLLMIFRPNLSLKVPPSPRPRNAIESMATVA